MVLVHSFGPPSGKSGVTLLRFTVSVIFGLEIWRQHRMFLPWLTIQRIEQQGIALIPALTEQGLIT
jgi:hypothetical protein